MSFNLTTDDVWESMKARCQNSKLRAFKNYGGRGIKVCDSWQKFDNFYADMGELWDRFGHVGIRGTSVQWSWGRPMRWATWGWTGERIAAFEPEALIERISPRPVLIIHGEHDNAACTVPDAHRLYRAARQPKDLWIVPQAGHCNAHVLWPEEYETRVLTFFEHALRADLPGGTE